MSALYLTVGSPDELNSGRKRAWKRVQSEAEDQETVLNTEGGTSAKKKKNDESGKDK